MDFKPIKICADHPPCPPIKSAIEELFQSAAQTNIKDELEVIGTVLEEVQERIGCLYDALDCLKCKCNSPK